MGFVSKTNTFVVQVAYQQNGTWQGTVKWTDRNREEHFRSTLELIKMIDDAVKSDADLLESESEK